jgi:hypothetical protein
LQRLRTSLFGADEEESPMNKSRINPGKALSKSRDRRRLRSPETVAAQSSSPLDALVKGLVSIGERFFKGNRAQLRIP